MDADSGVTPITAQERAEAIDRWSSKSLVN
jgi:hypothetical protein